jgi:hypothetical protein
MQLVIFVNFAKGSIFSFPFSGKENQSSSHCRTIWRIWTIIHFPAVAPFDAKRKNNDYNNIVAKLRHDADRGPI